MGGMGKSKKGGGEPAEYLGNVGELVRAVMREFVLSKPTA